VCFFATYNLSTFTFFQQSQGVFSIFSIIAVLIVLSLLLVLMSNTPPTSPQQYQAAGRHAERASRTLGSPEQRRTPANTSTARRPITFQGQTYHHLPADLAAQLAALPPMPAPPLQHHGQTPATSLLAPPPVSLFNL
jgi:hypothetical protein